MRCGAERCAEIGVGEGGCRERRGGTNVPDVKNYLGGAVSLLLSGLFGAQRSRHAAQVVVDVQMRPARNDAPPKRMTRHSKERTAPVAQSGSTLRRQYVAAGVRRNGA